MRDQLVQSIRYHHNPLNADVYYKAIVYAVNLANDIFYYIAGLRTYNEINYKVLKFFKLEKENRFITFVKQLNEVV